MITRHTTSSAMNRDPYELVEQRAIELMSSLGQEHLFVANCPSNIDANKYAGSVITYEEAFDHSNTGVGLCLLLPRAYVLQKLVDICLQKDTSLHFVFTCPSNTCEFEAAAWIYNMLQEKVQHVGFMQNLGITCSNGKQEKYIIACQVEPNATHCRIAWTPSCRTLEYVFPRQVVERQQTVEALQRLPEVTYIDFRRPNGCHRISDQVDVTALTVQINSDKLADLELVESCIQPTVDAAWTHGLAECQVKQFFPWNDKQFQKMFPHGITMSVVDLKNFSNVALSEILGIVDSEPFEPIGEIDFEEMQAKRMPSQKAKKLAKVIMRLMVLGEITGAEGSPFFPGETQPFCDAGDSPNFTEELYST